MLQRMYHPDASFHDLQSNDHLVLVPPGGQEQGLFPDTSLRRRREKRVGAMPIGENPLIDVALLLLDHYRQEQQQIILRSLSRL
jgi:hypothetical protein